MAGEIKNTLTLDVSKFSSALEKAIGGTESLEKHLKSAAKVAADFDKGIIGVGTDMANIAGQFRMLDQTISNLVSKMMSVGNRLEEVGSSGSRASKGVEQLGSALQRTSGLNADAWIKKYSESLDQLAPHIKKTISSMLDLDRAAMAAGDAAEKGASKTIAAKLKTLETEQAANKKLIAERRAAQEELAKIQRTGEQLGGYASIKTMPNGSERLSIRNGTGQMVKQGGDEEAFARAALAAKQESAAVEALIKELEWKNAEIAKSIKLTIEQASTEEKAAIAAKTHAEAERAAGVASKEAAAAAKQASEASAVAAREAAAIRKQAAREAAEYERQQAQQLAQMWKGMGQMWAASKIEKGFVGSVNSADKWQREQLTLQGLNLPKTDIDYITKKAWDDSAVLKFVSALDMVKGRIAMMGGMPNISQEQIDKILPQAAMVAHNISTVTGDHSQAGFENMIRNISGVIESRGQTRDLAASKSTIDLIQKMYLGTGRKIDIADLETFLRRDNLGANTISDEGLAKMVSFMDEAKVSGGHGGGQSGAGVSTVGTAVKMFQKMANGGLMTERAATEFSEAGLMDKSSMNGKTGKAAMKALREGGLTVAADANKDPVAALEKIANAAFAYMTNPKNVKKYFGDMPTDSEEGRRNAMRKFGTETGWTVSAQSMLMTAGDKDKMDRAHAQGQKIMNSKGAEAMNADAMKSYAGNIDSFNASLENLKISLGTTILPLVTKFVEGLNSVLAVAQKFVAKNPLSTELTMTAVAIGGVVLAFKGFANVFGIVGTLSSVLRSLTGFATSAGAATGAAGAAANASRTGFLNFGGTLSGLKGHWADFGQAQHEGWAKMVASSTGASSSITSKLGFFASAVGNTAKLVGGAFLRMIPLVGQLLLAWDFAQLIGQIKVGGHEISSWLGRWLDSIVTAWKYAWADTDKERKDLLGGFWKRDTERGFDDASKRKLRAKSDKILNGDNSGVIEGLDINSPGQKKDNMARAAAEAKKAANAKKEEKKNEPFSPPGGGNGAGHVKTFEDSFARQFYSAEIKAQIEQLKLDALNTGDSTFDEQAHQQVIKMWAGGDLDNGKDPSKRKFLKGAKYGKDGNASVGGKGYDPLNPWGVAQMDWDAKVTIGKDADGNKIEKSLRDLEKSIALDKERVEVQKGLSFAKERTKSLDQEADAALVELTGATSGQTDAMKALLREYERLEARTPGLKKNAGYQEEKQKALADRATIDYANEATALKKKSSEIEASLVINDRDRAVDAAQVKADAERKRVMAFIEGLNIQKAAMEAAGQADTAEYKKVIAAKKAGEEEFSRYLKLIEEQRKRESETSTQKMIRDWQEMYNQLDKLGDQMATGFMDNISKMLTTGKADWRNYFLTIGKELASLLMKKGMAEMLGGPEGVGGTTLGSLAKGAVGGQYMNGGGIVGQGINWMNGFRNKSAMVPNDGPQLPGVAGAGASVPGAAEAEKLGKSLGDATKSVEAAASAQDGLSVATQAGTAAKDAESAATEMATTVTQADTVAVQASTVATTADAVATDVDTVATTASAVSEEVDAAANIFDATTENADAIANQFDATTENADAIANQFDAATEYLADGGVADQFGLSYFADGGAFTNGVYSDPTIFKFANGGQFGVMGEAGPEAVMPLSRDGKGRLGVNVNNGSTTTDGNNQVVTINISVNKDGSGTDSTSGNVDDATAWRRMATRVKGVVREELAVQQRPGGQLYK